MNRKTAFILIASCFLVCIAPCIHAENSSLVNTREAYEKSLQSVESNYEDELQAALCQYGAGVEKVREMLQKQGDLDGLIVAMREKRRFKAEKTVPATAPSDFPELLKKLWSKHNEVVTTSKKDRSRKTAALKRRYVARLEGLKKELTVANKLTEALKVKAELEKIRKNGRRTTIAAAGTVACSRCGGTGKVSGVCEACHGTGRCGTCRGTGFVNSKLASGKSKCLSCRGTGDCYSCKGRDLNGICAVCKGSGRVPGSTRTANSGIRLRTRKKEVPKLMDPEETKKEIDEYVQTMGSLNDLFRLGKFQSAEFKDVLAQPEEHLLRVLKSTVHLMDGHPRGVRVAASSSPGESDIVLLIPSTMWVGSKAKKMVTAVGKGGTVVITYAIVNNENTTLFDIEPPPGFEDLAAPK